MVDTRVCAIDRVWSGMRLVISPENRDALAYRVERRGGMPGFRLAISRRVARLLGGELTLDKQSDAGSTFTLWLPGSTSSVGAS